MLSKVIWHFSKIADFWVFRWYFWVSQNRPIVFRGFQRSLTISTLTQKRKMVAPSMRSLSKALFSELSGEPLTKGLPIFVQKLFNFCYRESATFARSKYWKVSWSKNSVWPFLKIKVLMPPQKFALKIVKLSVKKLTFLNFLRLQFSSFLGRFRHQK